MTDPTTSMSAAGMRFFNKRAAFNAISLSPGSSAADLSRITGLGPQTISRILGELEVSALIKRGKPRRGQLGQPPTPNFVNPEGAFCIGCEIGWRHIDILVQNLGGEVIGRHYRNYLFPDFYAVLDEVAALSELLIELVPKALRSRIVGIGLALPSGLDRSAELFGAPHVKVAAWKHIDPVEMLHKASGLEVVRYNDGSAGCWGEYALLPLPRPKNIAYILVSTFIAAGLIVDGMLWEGPNGRSADLGSMRLTGPKGGPETVDMVASVFALEQKLLAGDLPVPKGDSMLWDLANAEDIDEWLNEASQAIADTIANTAAVTELDIVILDGALPNAIVEQLVATVRTLLSATPTHTHVWPTVMMGSHRSSAPALGASWLPMHRRYFSSENRDVAGYSF